MGNRVVLSVDFDGCLSATIRGTSQKFESHVFVEKLIKAASYYPSADLIVGSNRQSQANELAGLEVNHTQCFPTMVRLEELMKAALKDKTAVKLDRFLMGDIYDEYKSGSSFALGLKVKKGDLKINFWDFDEHKISLIYTQMHRMAYMHPDDEIKFKFYDDRSDILDALRDFFTLNPELIPANVTLALNKYSPHNAPDRDKRHDITSCPRIKGTGPTDGHYKSTIRKYKSKLHIYHPVALAKHQKELVEVVKDHFKGIEMSDAKAAAFDACETLQDLCFVASIRQKGGIFHLKNTTTAAVELAQVLNKPEFSLLKRKICPRGGEVRKRDLRKYAIEGHSEYYERSSSGSFLDKIDKGDEKFFSLSQNQFKKEPMKFFHQRIENRKSEARTDEAEPTASRALVS